MEENLKSPLVLASATATPDVATADASTTPSKTSSQTFAETFADIPPEMTFATSPEQPRYDPLRDPVAGIGFLLVLVNLGIFQFSPTAELFGGSFFFRSFFDSYVHCVRFV